MFRDLQFLIIFVLAVATLVAGIWALVEALKYPPDAYVAAGKRTKAFWGAITGAAALIAFLTMPYPLGFGKGIFSFFTIAALAGIIIFFVDVRPALQQVHRPGSS